MNQSNPYFFSAQLSVQEMLSCCTDNYACGGGMADNGWLFLASSGVVTERCLPYVSGYFDVPRCTQGQCAYGDPWQPIVATSPYAVDASATAIQTEIMTNGPVQAQMIIYEDYLTYTSGVYRHTTGRRLSSHAIKLLGWGIDAVGGDYWVVANSQGQYWGEHGFFRIARGTDECGVEDDVTAGHY